MKYTGLHQHSVYSVLDGLAKVKDIVERCKDLGMEGVCITDHGNQFAAYELNKECKKQNMKPIFANEFYIAPGSALVKEKVEGFKPCYHLILIAKNDIGYKNLMYLTSWAYITGKYYKPRIDMSVLKERSEGLICLSACIGGLPQQLFLEGREEEAEDTILSFKRIFGKNYFLEMQYSGLDEQTRVNTFFRGMSRKHEIGLVVTSDSHYVKYDDSDYHASLVAINTGSIHKKTSTDTDQDESGMYYKAHQYFIKSRQDLEVDFPDDAEAFENTNRIGRMCNVTFSEGNKYIPHVKGVEDEAGELTKQCEAALVRYLEDNPSLDSVVYRQRLLEELDVIIKMEFPGYFLVVSEYTQWAKKDGIMVGPGRGSAAGSLVSFVLGITGKDPIEYGLLFSRFLNRGRATRPLIEFPELTLEDYRNTNNAVN